MSAPLLCRDCAHFAQVGPSDVPICEHPDVVFIDPVWGTPTTLFCCVVRDESGACGPDARLFAPRRAKGSE